MRTARHPRTLHIYPLYEKNQLYAMQVVYIVLKQV